eukprot:1729971-Amphidinium_carterae.1
MAGDRGRSRTPTRIDPAALGAYGGDTPQEAAAPNGEQGSNGNSPNETYTFDDVIGVVKKYEKEIPIVPLVQTKRMKHFKLLSSRAVKASDAAEFLRSRVSVRPTKMNPNAALAHFQEVHGASLCKNVNALVNDGCPMKIARIYAYALEIGS